MNNKPLVYVAGPYTRGVPAHNVRNAILAGEEVLRAGAVPHIPHLNHLWDLVAPHDYETWMEMDFAVLLRCDALLRIPGESPGADREVEAAQQMMPVFHVVPSSDPGTAFLPRDCLDWLTTWSRS